MTGCATSDVKSAGSFDYLVSDGKHFVGNLNPKCFGGFEIDDEIEFGRLLDRQIAGLSTLQNFVHICRGTAKQIRGVCSITRKRSSECKLPNSCDEQQQPI